MDREYFGVNPKLSFKNYSGLNVVKLFISKSAKSPQGTRKLNLTITLKKTLLLH